MTHFFERSHEKGISKGLNLRVDGECEEFNQRIVESVERLREEYIGALAGRLVLGEDFEVLFKYFENGEIFGLDFNIRFFGAESYREASRVFAGDYAEPERRVVNKPFKQFVYYREELHFARFLIYRNFLNEMNDILAQSDACYEQVFKHTIFTTSSRARSGASVKVVDGGFTHTFILSAEEAFGGFIEVYYVFPNVLHWYFLTVGLTAAFFVVYIMYALFKERRSYV